MYFQGLTALLLAGTAVSAHFILDDDDHDLDLMDNIHDPDWQEIIARVHEVEGEMCHAHTHSHILMALDENYRNKVEMENLHADEYVARKRREKLHKLKQKEKLLDMEKKGLLKEHHRQILFSEYDDNIDRTPVVRIPVVFHILYDRDEYNFDVDQLESQIKVLNEDFRANNSAINSGDVNPLWVNRTGDTKVEFYLNGTDRRQVDNLTQLCASEFAVKNSTYGGLDGWDPASYLNVWTCAWTTGLLGYAQFPCLLDTIYEFLDGVVISVVDVGSEADDDGTFYFGNETIWGDYRHGRVLTHEIGHWLNLRHVWGDYLSCNQSIATDFVSDTPPSLLPVGGCPNASNTCYAIDPETGTDLPDIFENFMDYTVDECKYLFTEEQVWRMRASLEGSGCRRNLYYTGAILEGNETLQPSSATVSSVYFSCDDGCPIFEEYINDGYCDCSSCEDENDWTCGNCPGCPDQCGGYTFCEGGTTPAPTEVENESDSAVGLLNDASWCLTSLLACFYIIFW